MTTSTRYSSPTSSTQKKSLKKKLLLATEETFDGVPREVHAKLLEHVGRSDDAKRARDCGKLRFEAKGSLHDLGTPWSQPEVQSVQRTFCCMLDLCGEDECRRRRHSVTANKILKHIKEDIDEIVARCTDGARYEGRRMLSKVVFATFTAPYGGQPLADFFDDLAQKLHELMTTQEWRDAVVGGVWAFEVDRLHHGHFHLVLEVRNMRLLDRDVRRLWNDSVGGYGSFSFEYEVVEWDTKEQLLDELRGLANYLGKGDDAGSKNKLGKARVPARSFTTEEVFKALYNRHRRAWFGLWFNNDRRQAAKADAKRECLLRRARRTIEYRRVAGRQGMQQYKLNALANSIADRLIDEDKEAQRRYRERARAGAPASRRPRATPTRSWVKRLEDEFYFSTNGRKQRDGRTLTLDRSSIVVRRIDDGLPETVAVRATASPVMSARVPLASLMMLLSAVRTFDVALALRCPRWMRRVLRWPSVPTLATLASTDRAAWVRCGEIVNLFLPAIAPATRTKPRYAA